jgi:hypothetical protein
MQVGQLDGSITCSDCHTQPRRGQVRAGESCDFVLLTEYAVWKLYDKHSQAYAALVGERGRRMADLLHQDVRDARTGCLKCHAMDVPPAQRGEKFRLEDGVSCGGCHGPSRLPDGRGWFRDHTFAAWRDKSPAEKGRLGMWGLRDPAVKAELCLSCHVGNAAEGKIVTHAMFAAGHPPLPPVEIATFARNEPQHWRDSRDVPFFHDLPDKDRKRLQSNYDLGNADFQRTKLMVVGTVVALRETMRLAVARAGLGGGDPATLWPELLMRGEGQGAGTPSVDAARQRWPEVAMAHSDCFACHHDLANPSPRQQRGYGYRLAEGKFVRVTPGRPLVRAWPLALIDVAVDCSGEPARMDDLAGRLTRLTRSCNAAVFGKPQEVGEAARGVLQWCDELLAVLDAPSKIYDERAALRLLHRLCRQGAADEPDYETARQFGSAIQVVYQELARKAAGRPPAEPEELAAMARELNLQPYSHRARRLEVLIGVAQSLSRRKADDAGLFQQYVTDIGNRKLLEQMADNEFLANVARLDPREFDERLRSRDVSARLQALNEEELAAALQKVSQFRPGRFRSHLAALRSRLPAEPAPATTTSRPGRR